MVDPNTRQGKRTPVTLKIKFKSETLEQFIERYAVDVSQGGIFIRTKEPLSVGTQMKFEFQLRDASPLIAGEGTVVWTRENDPSRPAIAPGMGVRFDRLADGSQGILERILTEKVKQAPQRPASDTARPPLFTDTPTRVAPAPVQEALLGKDSGRGRRADDHGDSHTPLPRPMPFHSDADEFPDEAFEEATKVRALDELIAQTAEGTPEELTARGGRPNGRSDATVTDPMPDRAAAAEAAEIPDLPNPPAPARPHMPRIEPPEAMMKTQLGVEPARARAGASTPPPMPMQLGHVATELPPLPSGMRAVVAEETHPARMPPLRSRSIAPLLILIFLVVAAGGAAVWFLVLRPQTGEPRTPGSAAVATPPGSGAARVPVPPPAGGSAAAMATGSNPAPPPPAGSNAPRPDLVETVIEPSVSGASVEITGTGQSGPAPFTARLEKGKAYKARIIAHGYAALEIDLKGGDARLAPKLVAKPRFIAVSSEPPGAQILVDGVSTGHNTPAEIELTPGQAGKKSVHVVLRKAGFRALDRAVELSKMAEDDTRMSARLDEKLAVAPVVTPTRPGSGSGSARQPPGPSSDPGAGSDTAAPSGGNGSGGDAAAAAPTPPAPPPPSGGAGSGSAEPEPDFNKH